MFLIKGCLFVLIIAPQWFAVGESIDKAIEIESPLESPLHLGDEGPQLPKTLCGGVEMGHEQTDGSGSDTTLKKSDLKVEEESIPKVSSLEFKENDFSDVDTEANSHKCIKPVEETSPSQQDILEESGSSEPCENEQQEDNRREEWELNKKNSLPLTLREILMRLKPANLLDEDEEARPRFNFLDRRDIGDWGGDMERSEARSLDYHLKFKEQKSPRLYGSVRDLYLGILHFSLIGNKTNMSNANDSMGETSSGPSLTNKQAVCQPKDKDELITEVQIVNATILQNLLQNDDEILVRSTEAACHLVYFFNPYCPFSTAGSAYINALPRSLHNIPVYALDSVEYHSMNARYAVMGTPTLVLFHNGLVVGRYNASEYSVSNLMSFINHYTTEKLTYVNVTSDDFKGILSSQSVPSPQYTIWFAWVFLIGCGTWLFLSSEFFAKLTEAVLNNWREAEAQHAHED